MTSWSAPEQGDPIDPNVPGGAPPGYGYPPQPGYAPPGYPSPGYASPSYPPPGYPPGYAAPGHPAYGYPAAPGYPPYGYPSSPRDVRPGLATASAVLAFITAGLLILAGLLLFLGGAIADDFEDALGSRTHIGLELALDGVVNLVAAGLLIAGGVALVGRKANGRVLLSVGGGIVVAAALYWLVRFDIDTDGSWTFDSVLFLLLTALTLTFAWVPPVSRWLQRS